MSAQRWPLPSSACTQKCSLGFFSAFSQLLCRYLAALVWDGAVIVSQSRVNVLPALYPWIEENSAPLPHRPLSHLLYPAEAEDDQALKYPPHREQGKIIEEVMRDTSFLTCNYTVLFSKVFSSH